MPHGGAAGSQSAVDADLVEVSLHTEPGDGQWGSGGRHNDASSEHRHEHHDHRDQGSEAACWPCRGRRDRHSHGRHRDGKRRRDAGHADHSGMVPVSQGPPTLEAELPQHTALSKKPADAIYADFTTSGMDVVGR